MGWTRAKWHAVLLDFVERAGWSAGEAFFATLLAGGTTGPVTGLPWKYAFTLAVSAAVLSVLLTAVQYLTGFTKLTFWADLGVRLAKTFIGSFVASTAAAGLFDVTKFDWGTSFNVAVVATLGALGKGLLARLPQPAPAGVTAAAPAADGDNPSTLRPAMYDEAVDGHGAAGKDRPAAPVERTPLG